MLKWHTIAASLEFSTDAMLAETRVIVESKLTELGHEPFGVQVILSDKYKEKFVILQSIGVIK